MDDEYFRLRLCLNDAVRGHPDVKANLPTIFRSLERPTAEGLKRALMADWRTVEVKTPGGLYLGKQTAFSVDMKRIFRVIERTVRGLFLHAIGERLPEGYGVKVISNESLLEQGSEVVEELKQKIIVPLAALEPKVIGNGAFTYRYWYSGRDFVSAWGLVFYQGVQFAALTGPNDLRDTVKL